MKCLVSETAVKVKLSHLAFFSSDRKVNFSGNFSHPDLSQYLVLTVAFRVGVKSSFNKLHNQDVNDGVCL